MAWHERFLNCVYLLSLVILLLGLDALAMHWFGVLGVHHWIEVGPSMAVETAVGFVCIAVALSLLAFSRQI